MRVAPFLHSVLLLALYAPGSFAQTFREAVDLARGSEPAYLGVKANAVAAQERSNQAFAGLLPQISATASTNSNRRDYFTRGDPTNAHLIDHYNSNSNQLNLTQPVYRPANIAALRQAQSVVTQADYQRAAAEQDLLAKLITAWLDVMAARDGVLFTARQSAAARQQWDILRRGVELGTASAPAAEEGRAKHEQALADRVTAEMDQNVKTAALEQIVGPLRAFVPPFLSYRERVERLSAESLDTWLQRVEESPQVLAASKALAAAEEEIRKQRAAYQPTLDLVANYGRNAQQVGNFPGQNGYEIKTGTIGLQLNVPIFSGGGQVAKVDEAVALKEKARHEVESVKRAGLLATKQSWYGWLAANARHVSGQQGVRSALLSLRAAVVGNAAGIKSELEVLQAQTQLEAARRDFSKARYDVLASLARLKAAAGYIVDEDLALLEKLFTHHEGDLQEIAAR